MSTLPVRVLEKTILPFLPGNAAFRLLRRYPHQPHKRQQPREDHRLQSDPSAVTGLPHEIASFSGSAEFTRQPPTPREPLQLAGARPRGPVPAGKFVRLRPAPHALGVRRRVGLGPLLPRLTASRRSSSCTSGHGWSTGTSSPPAHRSSCAPTRSSATPRSASSAGRSDAALTARRGARRWPARPHITRAEQKTNRPTKKNLSGKKSLIVAAKESFVDERDLFWPAPPVMPSLGHISPPGSRLAGSDCGVRVRVQAMRRRAVPVRGSALPEVPRSRGSGRADPVTDRRSSADDLRCVR